MKRQIYISVLLALLVISSPLASAAGFSAETLPYKVMFKWGLINKHAGDVVISLDTQGSRYAATLTAKSASWADHVYRVRDTLKSVMDKSTLMPELYVKLAHEDGEFKRDQVVFTREGSKVTGDCTRYARKGNKEKHNLSLQIEAEGTTVDMLSSFYYMRTLPFENFTPGQSTAVNIFSGKRKELLTIKYIGRDIVKYDGRSFDCYHVSFIFTSDGKKKSSDDMDAWITADSRRLPVKIEGKLPVGKVRCFYTGQ